MELIFSSQLYIINIRNNYALRNIYIIGGKVLKKGKKKDQSMIGLFYIEGASSYSHTKLPWHYLRR